jgi:hypothetical protein
MICFTLEGNPEANPQSDVMAFYSSRYLLSQSSHTYKGFAEDLFDAFIGHRVVSRHVKLFGLFGLSGLAGLCK